MTAMPWSMSPATYALKSFGSRSAIHTTRLLNVTMRAPSSRRVSTTNPGASRVCTAPTSRMASQMPSAGASTWISLRMDAMCVPSAPETPDAAGCEKGSLGGQELLQLLARPLALVERTLELCGVCLEARDDPLVALVEEIEDLELGVHVVSLGLLELREQRAPKAGRHRVGLSFPAPELDMRLVRGVAERDEPVGRGRALAPECLDEFPLPRGRVAPGGLGRQDVRRCQDRQQQGAQDRLAHARLTLSPARFEASCPTPCRR